MVAGLKDNRIRRLGHGEKRRRIQCRRLKSVASKCGGKSPTFFMTRSLPRCPSALKLTSNNTRNAKQCLTGPEKLLGWVGVGKCFKWPRGSINTSIKKFKAC